MRRFAILLAAIGVLFPALLSAPAEALSFRTFVSGSGIDTGSCTRAAPCLTFGYAIGQSLPGGEINCLSSGEFGGLTIPFALTISCEGGSADVGVGTNIVINAASTDDVTLRGLDINGFSHADIGISIVNARTVHIENCAIRGFSSVSTSSAIFTPGGGSTIFIFVTDSVLSGNSNGLNLRNAGGYKIASLKNVTIAGSTNDGVVAENAAIFVNITESVISGNGGNAVRVAAGGSEANIDRSTIANNATALLAGASGATIRSIGNNIFNNTYGFAIAGGATIATDGQNRAGGNVNNQAANASVTLQ